MNEYPDGWALVPVDDVVVLQMVSPSSTPGQLVVNRWPTPFRVSSHLDEFTAPVLVRYISPGVFDRADPPYRRYYLGEDRPSAQVFFLTVARDLRRGGDTAEWRWDSCHGYWERYYKSGWRRMPRIIEHPL